MRSLALWSARNPVAANVLMIVVFICGFQAVMGMNREHLPEFDLDMVTVSVPYPGASPEEIEKASPSRSRSASTAWRA